MAEKQTFSIQKSSTKQQVFTHEEIVNYLFNESEELSEVSEEECRLFDVSDGENLEPELLGLGEEMHQLIL